MKDTPEHAAIVSSKIATYIGALTAVASGLTITEWGVVVGIVVGVLGLVFGQYWSWRKEFREQKAIDADEVRKQELHRAQLAFLNRKRGPTSCDSLDIVEAQALGIDTADWPASGMGALNG
ncbi:hypothetical protein [Comamonas serinivorans]|uniref:hypothetical protein n=1 Tax=Comamonas serinivorans TaxID=1082851 RepID=UPI0012F84D3C|nr:hypothetical protein [Comamonas serinivorans]